MFQNFKLHPSKNSGLEGGSSYFSCGRYIHEPFGRLLVKQDGDCSGGIFERHLSRPDKRRCAQELGLHH